MFLRKKPNVFGLSIADNFPELPYLPIGMLLAYLRVWEGGTLNKAFNIHPIVLGGVERHPMDDAMKKIISKHQPVCLLSSYVWNHEKNLAFARKLKQHKPDAVIIFGGPEVPKYEGKTEDFLAAHDYVDVAVLGEGEVSCAQVLHHLLQDRELKSPSLREIDGIVYRSGDDIIRTNARARIKNVNELPSPYLTGEFDPWFNGLRYTVLETNRGCPFGCVYCDWGSATLEKVTKFDPDRVIREIEYIAEKRSDRIFIADANFGMLEQDIAIAEALVAIKKRTGYPRRLYSNFAKNGGRRLMQVIKILHDGGLLPRGIVALQTTDPQTLKTIKRDNIKTSSYEDMMAFFNEENIPMASDLMIGLPGQTVDSFAADLQFCFDWKISANGNFTSMMPNAPMAEESYMNEHEIAVDEHGLIASTSTFSGSDLFYMKALYLTYLFHVRLGILKYYLYYLQVEHNIQAIDLLRTWLDRVLRRDQDLPLSQKVFDDLIAMDKHSTDWAMLSWGDEAAFLFENLTAYCEEFHQLVVDTCQLDEIDSRVLQTLFATQKAVIPNPGHDYPFTQAVEHDVAGYFGQLNRANSLEHLDDSFQPLVQFGSAEITVTPKRLRPSVRYVMIDGHSNDWEYESNITLS